MSKKFGSNRSNVRRKVYRMRTKNLMSWQAIAAELEIAPRTARKLFQEQAGEHQHHDHLPNRGGRFPSGQYTKDETVVVWTPEEAAYLAGDGSHNTWHKSEIV
jgi:hypothetical protein